VTLGCHTNHEPQLPGSPVPPPETTNQDPALLEWYPHPIHSLCPLAIKVQELRAQVGYLQLEAQRNIQLRTELHENHCKVVAEARELRETVSNLAEQQKLEDRRCLDANRSKEFEITINTKIAARKSDEIERELQLRRELKDAVKREIGKRWTERIQTWEEMAQTKAVPMEGITTNDDPTPPVEKKIGKQPFSITWGVRAESARIEVTKPKYPTNWPKNMG
jgi:hypothetical protein